MLCMLSYAQHFTSVTGTIQDTASQTWGNATIIMSFQGTPGVAGPFLNQGVPITNTPQTTVADGSGNFSFTLDSNNTITPSGSTWIATVCSNTSAICSNFTLTINGTSQNVSTTINPFLPPPVVNAAPTLVRAYNDTEVNAGNGAIYWRTSDNSLRGCQATPIGACTWVAIGNGSTIVVPGTTNQIPFNNGSGNFTANGCLDFNPNTATLETCNGSFFGIVNISGIENVNIVNTPDVSKVVYIDGTTFARTCAGINSAVALNTILPGTTIIIGGGGDIPCGQTITIDKPVIIKGSGRGSRLVPSTGFAGPVISFVKDGNCTLNLFGQCVGAELDNIWIEDTGFRSQNTNGISIQKWDSLVFNNVEIRSLKGYALKLGNNSPGADSVVRESRFNDFRAWWCGDQSQSLPCIWLTGNQNDGDVVNDIWMTGKVVYPMWEAIRSDTSATTGTIAAGPGGIHINHFQVEGREVVSDSNLQSMVGPAVPLFHVVLGQDFFVHDSFFVACGQNVACVQMDGTNTHLVSQLDLTNNVIGSPVTVSGVVNTSGSTVTWISGNQFVSDGTLNGQTITINSVNYIFSSCSSTTSCTLTTSAGTQSGVNYTIVGGGYGVATVHINSFISKGNEWFSNPLGNLNIVPSNGGFYQDAPPVGNTTYAAGSIIAQPGVDLTWLLKNTGSPNGQGWYLDSKTDGNFYIIPDTDSTKSVILGNFLCTGGANCITFREKKNTAGCTTGSSIGNTCGSPITVSWSTSFADTNYSVSCTGGGTITGVPGPVFYVTKSTGNVTVNYMAMTAAAASYTTVDCEAIHD